MLTQQQHDDFAERGYIRVVGAFSRDAAAKMVDRFWHYVEQHQSVRRDDRSTWIEGIVTGIADLKSEPEFQQIGSLTTIAVLDDLLGQDDWRRPATWGQILATFPAPQWRWNSLHQGQSDVDRINWHTDYEYSAPPEDLAGVQVFAILADLEPGGGGTLVIEGSPRLIRNFVSHQPQESLANMKRTRVALLRSHPWLAELSQAVSLGRPEEWLAEQRTVIDGVPLAVAELMGRAGDIVFCHPWLLHASSPNCNETPRLMCTQRIRRRQYDDPVTPSRS